MHSRILETIDLRIPIMSTRSTSGFHRPGRHYCKQARSAGSVCVTVVMHDRSPMIIWYRPSHPYNAGMEHVGFLPNRQSAKRAGGEGMKIVREHAL